MTTFQDMEAGKLFKLLYEVIEQNYFYFLFLKDTQFDYLIHEPIFNILFFRLLGEHLGFFLPKKFDLKEGLILSSTGSIIFLNKLIAAVLAFDL